MQEREELSLTPEEVARILKITRNTVYELVKRGELSAFRVGRKLRIDQRDVDIYKQKGKKMENASISLPGRQNAGLFTAEDEGLQVDQQLVICGHDILLDILARHLERYAGAPKVWRQHVGSFEGLGSLYRDKANMAAIHLWDADSDTYNIPYVRRLLPGIPAILVNLAVRWQGFYVIAGNPKKINNWADLTRSEIRFINREKGCGSRVLLDEKIRQLGLNRLGIEGYSREEYSHLAVASAVARGEADVALGNQKASMQVRGIEFVPMQEERYDLVMKKEDANKAWYKATLELISSQAFQDELQGLGDYELTHTGQLIEV